MSRIRIALFSCLGALAVAAVSFGVFVIVGISNLTGPCGNEVLEEAPSPGGRYEAVAFQRDCGATTGFSTQVSVLPAGAGEPEGAGNAFQATTNDGAAPSGPGGGPEVSLEWTADETLLITYDARARASKTESRPEDVAKDVKVKYRAVGSEGTTSP